MHILHDISHYLSILYRLFTHSLLVPAHHVLEIHAHGAFLRHSLRSPLTAILINLESDIHSQRKTPAYTERALAASRYLAQLLQPETKNTFDALVKLKQVTAFLSQPQDKKYVYLISKLDRKIKLTGPVVLFQEAISCLITNGFEAYRPAVNKIVVVSIWNERRRLCLTVTDFGTGMTWLTKKLSTAKGFSIKDRNSGYGLWFVAKIIEDSFQGKVTIGSQSRVGTSIKIELPYSIISR